MKDQERKITVEGLLRLKRAERPPPEFWAGFESAMRAKQLAAIVVRRPWWDGFSGLFAVVYRNHIPFGAAAALALTWMGMHYAGGPSLAAKPAPSGSPEQAAAPALPPPAVPAAVRTALPAETSGTGAAETAQPQPLVVSTTSHLTKAPEAAQPESISATPFADGISVSLADFRATESDLSKRGVFGSDREFEASVAPARQPAAEPLLRVDPSGERLERLLAPALPAYSSSSSRLLASERMKQRAVDDRIYESMDRYGTGGMSLEFRF
jgi:hypothetical protein